MTGRQASTRASQIAGIVGVVTLHALALYGLWSARLIPSPVEAATLFVNFIAPPTPQQPPEPKRPPAPQSKPHPIAKQSTQQLVAQTPVLAAAEDVAPPPPAERVPEAPVVVAAPVPALPLPPPPGPVAMSSELSVACPERSAPVYPAQSRRAGEVGRVVLWVEVNETGQVALAKVQSSSGYARLDDAALGAVRTWRCTPPMRNGQPARATALQPFNFVIQGN